MRTTHYESDSAYYPDVCVYCRQKPASYNDECPVAAAMWEEIRVEEERMLKIGREVRSRLTEDEYNCLMFAAHHRGLT